jgi:hypothetical protein
VSVAVVASGRGTGHVRRGFTGAFIPASAGSLKQVLLNTAPRAGNALWWSRLYRVGNYTDAEEHAQKLMRRLETYLSLAFHRFLSGRPRVVKITLDMFDQKVGGAGIPIHLDALDPFAYERSVKDGFPAGMSLQEMRTASR